MLTICNEETFILPLNNMLISHGDEKCENGNRSEATRSIFRLSSFTECYLFHVQMYNIHVVKM